MRKKTPAQKNASAYLVLLIILMIVIVALCIVLFGGKGGIRETPAPSAAPVTPAPPRDTPPGSQPVPEASAVPAASAQPVQTPEATEEPVFETREPLETTEPAAAGSVDVSGSFASDSGTYLNLLVNWAAKGSGDTAQLTVELCAQSYSLYTVASYGNMVLTVNGTTYYGDCPAINCEGKELTVTPLCTFTVEVPRGETEISAEWHFKGSYSGKQLDVISAAAAVYIG